MQTLQLINLFQYSKASVLFNELDFKHNLGMPNYELGYAENPHTTYTKVSVEA